MYDDASSKLNMDVCPHPLICFGCPAVFDKIWILLFSSKGGTHRWQYGTPHGLMCVLVLVEIAQAAYDL